MIKYSIIEYTETPGGRYVRQSQFSGEEFRNTVLVPLYERVRGKDEQILLNLDGTYGMPVGFLEEAFGGLCRMYPNEDVAERFTFICEDEPDVVYVVKQFMLDQQERNKQDDN